MSTNKPGEGARQMPKVLMNLSVRRKLALLAGRNRITVGED